MTEWEIEAQAFSNCNCDYCCPCQFELRPTHGDCRGIEIGRIGRGRFGEVALDGLCWTLIYAWPGAIFEGGGAVALVIDARADHAQRAALATILYGGETDDAATHWWVFRAMSSIAHEPVFKKIDLTLDIEARHVQASVPGVLTATGRPIANPVDGGPHRVQICHPQGIEFERAEIGSGSTQVEGPIAMVLADTYGQFNRIHHTGRGMRRSGAA